MTHFVNLNVKLNFSAFQFEVLQNPDEMCEGFCADKEAVKQGSVPQVRHVIATVGDATTGARDSECAEDRGSSTVI